MNGAALYDEQSPSIGELLASFLQPAPMSDEEAMHFAGFHLAGLIARNSSADFEDVWRELCHLPDGLLVLLDNPAGWQALSAVTCGLLKVDTAPVTPVLN